MALTRTQKQEMVDRYAGGLANAPHAFLIAYQGIKVNDVTELRARIRARSSVTSLTLIPW